MSAKRIGAKRRPAEMDEVAAGESPVRQQMLELPIRVVDSRGKPVASARVSPWALRSSQGHGWWGNNDKTAGVGPEDVDTDAAGNATVHYPYYRNVQERIRTISVSLHVDHPEFAFLDHVHIDVPLESPGSYAVELADGATVEIRPLLDGKPADLEGIFALWSDGRSYQPRHAPEKLAGGVLRIPAMPAGSQSVLVVKLDAERATHFSRITDFQLTPGKSKNIDIPLQPSVPVRGVLSDNVPRPVREGRVKVETLAPAGAAQDRVSWCTWAAVHADTSFTINGWPADEPMQLIALCDGYIATSGITPAFVQNPFDPGRDPFNRPQVFQVGDNEPVEVAMTPLARCIVTAVDENDVPVAGVTVVSWPNVCWWNSGSQIYCELLVRGERLLRQRDYMSTIDDAYADPFEATTDAQGKATLQLPVGNQRLAVSSDLYELPVFLGRRNVEEKLPAGKPR